MFNVFLQTNPGTQIRIRSFINTKAKLSSFVIVELKTELKIVTLLSTQTCCHSGNKIIVFSMARESAELFQQIFIDLPGIYSQLYANPHQKFDFYAIPHRSRQLHFLHMSLEVSESVRVVQSDVILKRTTLDDSTIYDST
jgi:hypothetical protein